MDTKPHMTKGDAIALFGSREAMEQALGITASAVSQWPEVLPLRIADRVRGAHARTRGASKAAAA